MKKAQVTTILIIIILLTSFILLVSAQKNYSVDINQPISIGTSVSGEHYDYKLANQFNVFLYKILFLGLWFVFLSHILNERKKLNETLNQVILIILIIMTLIIIYNSVVFYNSIRTQF
ncbi:MAG: hypothetical protein Q8N99_02450 [Nanoarchaeota archaeon]|nr:hypothetical protein [Nanoarchaeota archaeon]